MKIILVLLEALAVLSVAASQEESTNKTTVQNGTDIVSPCDACSAFSSCFTGAGCRAFDETSMGWLGGYKSMCSEVPDDCKTCFPSFPSTCESITIFDEMDEMCQYLDFSELYGELPGEVTQRCISTPGAAEQRCFSLFVPSCSREKVDGVPLVLDMHSHTSCAVISATYNMGWLEKSQEECFVVAFPDGKRELDNNNIVDYNCWEMPGGLEYEYVTKDETSEETTNRCCCSKYLEDLPPETRQDPLFIRNVVVDIVSLLNENVDNQELPTTKIDTKRIYMAGHSNGCMLSMAMAALHSDIVSAVCCHAGALVTPFGEDYSPVPIWRVHGKKDDVIPYDPLDSPWDMPFVPATEYIANKNGCSLRATERGQKIVKDTYDNIVGSSYTYEDCNNDATVEVVVLDDEGHYPYYNFTDFGPPMFLDTTAMAWDFCSSHSKSEIPEVFLKTKGEEEEVDAETSVSTMTDSSMTEGEEKEFDAETSASTMTESSMIEGEEEEFEAETSASTMVEPSMGIESENGNTLQTSLAMTLTYSSLFLAVSVFFCLGTLL